MYVSVCVSVSVLQEKEQKSRDKAARLLAQQEADRQKKKKKRKRDSQRPHSAAAIGGNREDKGWAAGAHSQKVLLSIAKVLGN